MSILFLQMLLFAVRHRAAGKPLYVPQPKRVFVVVLENQDSATHPFLDQLASGGALLTNDHGVTHPSQPNYIALAAGSTYGVTSDNPVTIDARNFADLLDARGLTWKVYAEDYPGDCFTGVSADGGLYVRRHVPFLEFADIQLDASRCARIVDASQLDADVASGALPSFSLFIPNDQHNGHDTSTATADEWLRERFGPLLQDPRFMNGTLFVVTFDESSASDNRITTVLFGDGVRPGARSSNRYDHFNLLATLEQIFGTGSLGQQDLAAGPFTGIWR